MSTFRVMKTCVWLTAALTGGQALAADYQIDPTHTSVVASWSHFGFSHPTATFAEASGSVSFDESAPEQATISVTIPVKSVDTRVPALTEEFLNGVDYFEVAKYPTATFTSTKVTALGDNRFEVAGDLTIKGVTKPVVMQAQLNAIGEHPMTKKPAIGFDATTVIKRTEFNMGIYAPYVSDEVILTISTEAQGE